MASKTVITCALTGVLTDPVVHHVPVTPEEMAEHAAQAYDAGASIVHCHFRNQQKGLGHLPTWDLTVVGDAPLVLTGSMRAASDPGSVDPAEARHIIDSVTEILCLEIQKTYDFFKSTATVDRIDQMIISGGASHTPGLIETLSQKFEIPTEMFDSFRKIAFDPKKFSPSMIAERSPDFAIAVGLALRSAEG